MSDATPDRSRDLRRDLHAAHKARLARLGGPARRAADPPEAAAAPEPPPDAPALDDAAPRDEPLFETAHLICDALVEDARGPIAVSRLTIPAIAAAVCARFGAPPDLLFARRRAQSLVRARQALFWLARRHTPLSLSQIGQRCAGYDHTTVLHGAGVIDNLLARAGAATGPDWRANLETIAAVVTEAR